jgi:hypothetical protein
MDGDGLREVTAWLGADDAFLVIDLAANGLAGADGRIEQQKELALAAWIWRRCARFSTATRTGFSTRRIHAGASFASGAI